MNKGYAYFELLDDIEIFGWEKWRTQVLEVLDVRVLGAEGF